MSAKCPVCKKAFDELHTVHNNNLEPFTGVEPMEGLKAWGAYSADKELICHEGAYVHFRFLDNQEERLVQMLPLDLEHLTRAHEHHEDNPLPCEHEGCTAEGRPCYYTWLNDAPDGWYCAEHCDPHGFCWSCGLFSAGFESFDFNPSHLCASCQEAYDSEYNDDDDYGWDEYDDDFDYDGERWNG